MAMRIGMVANLYCPAVPIDSYPGSSENMKRMLVPLRCVDAFVAVWGQPLSQVSESTLIPFRLTKRMIFL